MKAHAALEPSDWELELELLLSLEAGMLWKESGLAQTSDARSFEPKTKKSVYQPEDKQEKGNAPGHMSERIHGTGGTNKGRRPERRVKGR